NGRWTRTSACRVGSIRRTSRAWSFGSLPMTVGCAARKISSSMRVGPDSSKPPWPHDVPRNTTVSNMRLVQIVQPDRSRRTAIVDADGNRLTLLDRVDTVYDLAQEAIAGGLAIATLAGARAGKERVSYEQAIGERRLLTPLDHPEPARFWITGTGLTHIGSA